MCRVWLLHLFTTYVFIFATATYWNFRPSYIEHQFRKSATDADYYAGLSSLLRGVVGCGVSGIAVVWIRPKARQIMSANVLFTFCAMGAYTGLVWIGCLKLHLQGRPMGANVSACASECACSDKFAPMCSSNGDAPFYSPCFAGCATADASLTPVVYTNCSCLGNASTSALSGVDGFCPETCHDFFNYMAR